MKTTVHRSPRSALYIFVVTALVAASVYYYESISSTTVSVCGPVLRNVAENYTDLLSYPLRTPDVSIDSIVEVDDSVILCARNRPPQLTAIPGGFVNYGEAVEEAVIRETLEETSVAITHPTLLAIFSDPLRDRRRHTISLTYVTRANVTAEHIHGKDDVRECRLYTLADLVADHKTPHIAFAFDHRHIIQTYLKHKGLLGWNR